MSKKEQKSRSTSANWSIPELAIRRPISVIMFFIAALVIGVVAYSRIPLQLLPSGFSPPFLYVTVPTIPSTPADVDREIVIPVEGLLRTLPGVEKIRSRARPDNAGFFVMFRDGTNMDVAYNQVRDRLERARVELPPEAQKAMIWKFSPDDDPLIFLGVRIRSDAESRAYVLDKELVQPLEQLASVSRVEVRSSNALRVEIAVDEKRANAAGIPITTLIQTLRNDNFAMSGGALDNGVRQFPIRILAKLKDVDAIKNLPITQGLRLSEIADIRVQHTFRNQVYHVDGDEGAILTIFREPTQNAVEAAQDVRKLVDQVGNDPRLQISVLFDQGAVIKDSLDNLTETALWGGFFSILILFLFLRRFRIMAITALAIPISMLLTLVVMYLSNTSLNALSLMGLMLSVGMVVDNSIVVTEAIQRRRTLGDIPRIASGRGASEVGLAIVVATSTTIIVFLPMVLMSGSETLSFFLGKIGFPVCISLIASLVVSLIFIPLALNHMDTRAEQPKMRIIEALQDGYARALGWCLTHRQSAVLLIFLSLATLAIPLGNMKETDSIQANVNDVRVFFSFETTATYSERLEKMRTYEKWVMSKREDLEVDTLTMHLGGMWGHPEIRLFLKSVRDRQRSREQIIEELRANLPRNPGVRWRLGWGNSEQNITVAIEGKDALKLKGLAEQLAKRLENIDGVFNVIVGSNNENALEMHYFIEREKADKSGVSPLMIGGAIDYALRGRKIGKVDYNGQEADLWIRISAPSFSKKTSNDANTTVNELTKMELDNTAIPTPVRGPGIAIGNLTRTTISPGFGEISRTNGQTRTRIQLMTTRDDLSQLGEEIDAILSQFHMPKGYEVLKGQRFQDLAEEQNDRQFALLLAIVFVFLLMGILFESFILPFVIVLSIPFAFLGVYWTLYLTGTPFDVMAGVGLIILVGIVVNNAIVLVDRINVNLSTKNRIDSLIDAGRVRLRPIVMTALTTIGGLIPMAIGSSQIVGIPYAPLGRTVIGGLLASTFFTLFVVPVFYTLFDDLRRFWKRASNA